MDLGTLQHLRHVDDDCSKDFETETQAALHDPAILDDVDLKVWNSFTGDWLKDHRCVVLKMKKRQDHVRDTLLDYATVARLLSRFATVQDDPENPMREIYSVPPSAIALLKGLVNSPANVFLLDTDFYKRKQKFFRGVGRMDDRLRRYLECASVDFAAAVDEWINRPEFAKLPPMEQQWLITFVKEGLMNTPWYYGSDITWSLVRDGARWFI